MKIILLGYGKMGRIIASMAEEAGDEVVLRVDESNRASLRPADLRGADVAIEFSRPEAAVGNIDLALAAGVPAGVDVSIAVLFTLALLLFSSFGLTLS